MDFEEEDIKMWKIVIGTIGIITTIIAKTLAWEIIGISIILLVTLLPKRGKKLKRLK